MTVDAPPLPQQTVHQTNFVPYERDSYAKAHALAKEQIARRYPASVEYLEAEQSLTQQYLNAQTS